MTNSKATKLSQETKTEIKEIVGLKQGVYDAIEIIPNTTKRAEDFNEMVSALKAGKFFVLREGYTRNSVYVTLKRLEDKAQVKASFGQTKTVVDGKEVKQYVLFVKKE